jgi:16S rRNA (adenine1518-N6/adenine1519-N6)-dimethyltransferase
MTGAQGRREVRALLARHGHHPNKTLGQHFLVDPNVVARIVRTAGVGAGDRVVEIGAGTGTLTRALAATGAQVVAFEIDRHLGPVLQDALAGVDVDLRFEEATAAKLTSSLEGSPWVMVANLPYNVGTSLVLDVLREVPAVARFVVMVQREVADRLAAGPGSRIYGLPSVVAGLRARVSAAFRVGREVFFPPPDVDSAVVVLERVEPPPHVRRAEALAAAAFGQRRKMLRRSLADVLPDAVSLLEAAGIDPAARPETLAPEDFVRLAAAEAA